MEYPFHHYLQDLQTIYKNILEKGTSYDLIIGIQRGGLVPAVHLSNLLKVPMQVLQWSTRDSEVREGANPHLLCNKGKSILLVDDILDSGKTLKEIYDRYWKMDTAVLIYNNVNSYNIIPEYFAWSINRKETPDWINYWWER